MPQKLLPLPSMPQKFYKFLQCHRQFDLSLQCHFRHNSVKRVLTELRKDHFAPWPHLSVAIFSSARRLLPFHHQQEAKLRLTTCPWQHARGGCRALARAAPAEAESSSGPHGTRGGGQAPARPWRRRPSSSTPGVAAAQLRRARGSGGRAQARLAA